jgi:hypothetical protein
MFPRKRSFQLESLEARQMMAGDVAAYVQNGNLYLTEASGQAGMDNSVGIYQLANGNIRVEGRGALSDGTMSLINGAAYQDYAVPGSLYVNFGGGNDLVVIGAEGPGGATPSFNEVHIDVANPPPVIAPLTASANQPTGPFNLPDNDDVIIWGINTRGSMTVNTGDGDDWVYIADSMIGDGVGTDNLSIYTGAGADSVEIKDIPSTLPGNIFIQTYASLAETDADVVWFEHVYSRGDMQILLGGGNDLFHMESSSTLHDLYLDAGAGDDTATIQNVVAVDLFMAQMGDGNDSLSIDYLWGDKFSFQGGGGVDHLAKTANVFGHSLDQSGWEYINGRPVWIVTGVVSTGALTTKLA